MLYGTISEFCTPEQCSIMNAGPKFEFYWEDGDTYKKPTPLSAPAYVEALMTWAQNNIDDEKMFPQKIGVKFPPTFMQTAKTILRRLFRVYAHIYHSHFDQICALGIEGESSPERSEVRTSVTGEQRSCLLATRGSGVCRRPCRGGRGSHPHTLPHSRLTAAHLNTNYRHFLLFVDEFALLSDRDLQPLEEFNKTILEETKK